MCCVFWSRYDVGFVWCTVRLLGLLNSHDPCSYYDLRDWYNIYISNIYAIKWHSAVSLFSCETDMPWNYIGKLYYGVSFFQGRAYGNKRALWVRYHLQTHLFKLGCFAEKHCGKVLFLGLLLLSLCCVGLKTASLETNVERLWVEGRSLFSLP